MRALPLLSAWRLQLLTKSCVARVGSVSVTNICDATLRMKRLDTV